MGRRKRFEELSVRQKRTRLMQQRTVYHPESYEATIDNQLLEDECTPSQHEDESIEFIDRIDQNQNIDYDDRDDRDDRIDEDDTQTIEPEISVTITPSEDVELTHNDLFTKNLSNCFKAVNITHSQGSAILSVLRTHPSMWYLPRQARTLLESAKFATHIIDVAPGQYWHAGLGNVLKAELSRHRYIPERLVIDISTDGASSDERGSIHFWPIQVRIVNVPSSRPLIVGVYRGRGKPSSVNDFFKCFVDDIQQVETNGGLQFRDKTILLEFRAFIADAPARAFVLKHRGHNGLKPCSKCKVIGTHFRVRRRRKVRYCIAFVGTEFQSRTDDEYARRSDMDHHLEGQSSLAGIIKLVSNVPFEYMHLVCLGVMKKLCAAWISGDFSPDAKLSERSIRIISFRLEEIAKSCPQDFQRRPRSITKYKDYKATEFRQFLLYTGPVVLRGVLKEDYYLHFLLLHTSIRVLVLPNPSEQLLKYAEEALKLFVNCAKPLYGAAFLSYNVHGLLHLVEDVRNLGPLDRNSAFPFENNMPMFKKFVRTHHLPLQQFALRLMERNYLYPKRCDGSTNDVKLSMMHHCGPLPSDAPIPCREYKQLQMGTTRYSIRRGNNSCMLRDNTIGKIVNILENDGRHYLVIKRYNDIQPLYDCGITSEAVGIFKSGKLSTNLEVIPFTDVFSKCYGMKSWSARNNCLSSCIPGEHILMTLLHHH